MRTIDLSPSWRTALEIYAAGAINGTPEGQRSALESLRQIGDLLDRLAERDPEGFSEARKGLDV